MDIVGTQTEVPKYQGLLLKGRNHPAAVALLATLYLAAAALGLRFAFAGANVSPLWPPTGLAIAALVLYGPRLWPGVLAGAFLANLFISPLPAWVAGGIACGNCAEALIAAYLLKRVARFQPAFSRLKDTLYWILFAGVGAAVAASVGTTALALGHVVPWPGLANAWWTWFSGDTLGALVVGPVLLAWSRPPVVPWTRARRREAAGILVVLMAGSALIFLTPMARRDLSPLAFATLPLLIWAGHRLGPRGAAAANVVACAAAIWGTVGGLGAYAGFRELNEQMRLLQGFIAVAAGSSLAFATLLKERDLARERRQLSEMSFRRLVNSVKDYAIFMLDPKGRVVSWNAGAERIKGYRSGEILGRSFACFYPPEEVASGRPERDLEKAARFGSLETEGWRVRKDGTRFYADLTLSAIVNSQGELGGFAEVTRDITEPMVLLSRLRASKQELEEEVQTRTRQLAHSQQTLYLIYDGVQDPMAMVEPADNGFRIVSCNRAWASLRDTSPKDLVGRPFDEAVDPWARMDVVAALQEAARSGAISYLEQRVAGPEGEQVFDLQITPVLNEAGDCDHLLVAARDISERLRLEEAARHTQKLESLGVMAAGIAHDFNNLLTGIMGNAGLGLLSTEPGSRAQASFERIEQAAIRAADLTRQLLAYAGKGKFVVQDVDMNTVVQETTRAFPTAMPRKVHLREELAERLPAVKADPSQAQQMVMNLVTNAAEAVSADREERITIRTSARYLGAEDLRDAQPAVGLDPGHYVVLEVEDTGVGMDAELQSKIFDPFFTTKFTGRGLGLPALLGILRTHGGGIKVRSEPGVGSTFTLLLPAAGEAEPAAAPARAPWVWEGTLLLVDDDDMIRALARRIAEHLGLKVLEARDGVEAVAVFQESHRSLDLVLMDLTMPRMDGRDAFAHMRAIDPSVPIVLSSGYSEEEVVDSFGTHPPTGFLQKPYQREAFVLALQEGLRQSPRLRQDGSSALGAPIS
jgi:PAS domain S-box-containing protein